MRNEPDGEASHASRTAPAIPVIQCNAKRRVFTWLQEMDVAHITFGCAVAASNKMQVGGRAEP